MGDPIRIPTRFQEPTLNAWFQEPSAQMLEYEYFQDIAPPPNSGGNIKVYIGGSFVPKPVKYWDGSAWVVKPLKRWNGTAWVLTNY